MKRAHLINKICTLWLCLSNILLSGCAYIEKTAYFEPSIQNGWSLFQPKYDSKRYQYKSGNQLFEIYPIFAALNPCAIGLVIPIVPVSKCDDTKFSGDNPLTIELTVFSNENVEKQLYENFKSIITTNLSSYTPTPPDQNIKLSQGGSVYTDKPRKFIHVKPIYLQGEPYSYEYRYRFHFQVPEENLQEFSLEFPDTFKDIRAPLLTFKFIQALRKGIVLSMGP